MKGAAPSLAAPAFAQVNLLPTEIREARTLGVVKRWLVASVGVTALAVGTVAGVAQVQTRIAESDLAQVNATGSQLLVEQQPFLEVTTVRTELGTLRTALGYALGDEILWSSQLGALVAVTPAGVGIASLDYLGTSPIAAAPPSADPLVTPGLGTVSFTAFARDVPDTAAWADAIDAVPGFGDARLDSVALGQGTATDFRYQISGTFQVDADALSHRFDAPLEGNS